MRYLLSYVHSRKLGVSLGLLVVVGAVLIDLAFSGDPALSIVILSVVVIVSVVRRAMLGRLWPRSSDQRR